MYRIMIVEDDEKLARILGEELERYGYEAVWIDGRGSVREAFAVHKPDLVLLDVNLPRFDGYHWCRELRKITNVPIVFVSARSDAQDQVRGLENGGDDYITKPFNLELAIAKVQSVLRRAYGEYAHRCEVYGSRGRVSTVALSNFSMEVKQGDFVGIMGPSGSGKSTLLNLLATIDRPTSGKVFIDGVDTERLSRKELALFRRRRLGFVFQDFNLLETLTIAFSWRSASCSASRRNSPSTRERRFLRALSPSLPLSSSPPP